MEFKIGDNVRPLRDIHVSNKQMMFKEDEGKVIDIIPREDGHYLLVVKRNGEIFKGNEYLWEKA